MTVTDKKNINALYDGELEFGENIISCAVLEDEKKTRVLSQSEMVKALGRTQGGSKRGKAKLPRFISAKNINPYISKDLEMAILNPIIYKTTKGNLANGIPAKFLPEICEVWLKAKDDNVLKDSQIPTAEKAYMLIRGLAAVGIIALVDEATGYQDARVKGALSKILQQFLLDEKKPYIGTFPVDFYKEIYRLRRWKWNKVSTQKKPGVIGRYTNDLIYERLAPGLLNELKKRNPTIKPGKRKFKHFQFLTEEVGDPALRRHFDGILALQRASASWDGFKRLVNKSYPKFGDQLTLDLDIDYED